MSRILLLVAVAALAGCVGGMDHGAARDTGEIQPGAEALLTFDAAGTFELHCDPHPFMRHEVTVREDAPMQAHVHILDGNTTEEFRFDPRHIEVAPGAVVTYHNHGQLPHTASEMTAGMQH